MLSSSCFFFFFKQKTAYEIVPCDWSSDVCSSDLVTVLGAAGGALLGNQIEKTARATKQWELTVRYDNGSTQVFTSQEQPFWHQGDRVRYYEGKLQPV